MPMIPTKREQAYKLKLYSTIECRYIQLGGTIFFEFCWVFPYLLAYNLITS